MKISGAAITNTGGARTTNEDCVVAGSWIEQRSMIVPYSFEFSQPRSDVVLVADGMGGYRAGGCASIMAANAFLLNYQALTCGPDTLALFLKRINRSIFDASAQDMNLRGMGTTVAGIVCKADSLLWFNVGDSKVFRFRDAFIRQLSFDDVGPRVLFPGASKPGLTQAFGGGSRFIDIEPHIGTEPLVHGCRYLLCSDGLTDVVSSADIERIISDSDEVTVQMLLDTTLEKGAVDNISIIMITVKCEPADEWGECR